MDIIREVNVRFGRLKNLGDRWVDWNNELGAGPRGIWELIMTGEMMEISPRLWTSPTRYQCYIAIPMVFAFTGRYFEYESLNPRWPQNSLGPRLAQSRLARRRPTQKHLLCL